MPEGFESKIRRAPEEAETLESLRAENAALRAELAAERAAKEEALRHLEAAGIDALTDLSLRKQFESAANALFTRPPAEGETPRAEQRLPERLALLFVDADKFKSINDTHGHQQGDDVLRAIAGELKAGIRPTDLIARWGGEEMVIMLPGASEEDAALRAEELRQRIANLTFAAREGRFSVTASIGVASLENDGTATLEQLTKRADEALYAAKQQGRDRVVMASRLTELREREVRQHEFDFTTE